MKENYIAVLDSGIGGFSVLLPLIKKLPKERFVYFMDRSNFPYGSKNKRDILTILEQNIQTLLNKYPIKLIILACNTATMSAIHKLRQKFCVTILGISPLDCQLEGDETIFCTRLTAKIMPKTNKVVACNNLATEIENNIFDTDKLKKIVRKTFKPYSHDKIILGCTHYLLIKHIIQQEFPNIRLVDNSEMLLNNVIETLKKRYMLAEFKHSELIILQNE